MLFATEPFADLARATAVDLGLPSARLVVVPHPLGGTDEATVAAWADDAVDNLLMALEA